MTPPPKPPDKEQQLLRHARREGILIMAAWLIALAWSVGSAYVFGYNQDRPLKLILGMPDWVVWSVVVPWGICFLFTSWFCFFYMADDDLGKDKDGGPEHG